MGTTLHLCGLLPDPYFQPNQEENLQAIAPDELSVKFCSPQTLQATPLSS